MRLGAGFESALADIFEMPANDWLTGRGHQAFDREHVDPYLRRKENRKIGGWAEGFDPFYGAPVILIVLADKAVPTYIYDGALVMGNLMNAAESLGVGSIWIHRAKEEFNSEFGKSILKKLGIEGDYEGIGHVVRSGLLDRVKASLEKEGLPYVLLGGVQVCL